jgi:hypothetical protein
MLVHPDDARKCRDYRNAEKTTQAHTEEPQGEEVCWVTLGDENETRRARRASLLVDSST